MQDPLGNAVAISVPVPTQRFENRQALIAERLLATKRATGDAYEFRRRLS